MILFQIDEWMEYATVFLAGAEFEKSCTYVDNYLSLRTFLVGYSLSIADIAVWSGLAGMLFIIGHLYTCSHLFLGVCCQLKHMFIYAGHCTFRASLYLLLS